MFEKIDINNWKRKTHYEVYRQFADPRYDITFELDITEFLKKVRANGWSFTLAMIYTVARCANEIEEFRMRIESGKPVVFDRPDIAFTYLDDQTELMKNINIKYSDDVDEFILAAKGKIGTQKEYFSKSENSGIYQFSSIPWISYTHVTHTFSGDRDYAVPTFDFCKYYEKDGKIMLPFSVEVHHGFVDGVHIGKLADILQKELFTTEE